AVDRTIGLANRRQTLAVSFRVGGMDCRPGNAVFVLSSVGTKTRAANRDRTTVAISSVPDSTFFLNQSFSSVHWSGWPSFRAVSITCVTFVS
ncbi:hypothetical protein R0J87_20400, partial [Halomonas sp. SIMBA_159]